MLYHSYNKSAYSSDFNLETGGEDDLGGSGGGGNYTTNGTFGYADGAQAEATAEEVSESRPWQNGDIR